MLQHAPVDRRSPGFPVRNGNTSVRRVPGFSFFGFVLRRGEVGVGFQEAFPVAVEQIQRPEARVAEQAVLGGKRRDRRFGILIKHAVVPDAQAERDVQLRLFPVEHERLQDGIADVLPDLETALRDAELRFIHRAAFARDARDLIPLRAQDARERVRLMDQPRACLLYTSDAADE